MAMVMAADGGGGNYNNPAETRKAIGGLIAKAGEIERNFKKVDTDVVKGLREGWKGDDLTEFVNGALKEAIETAGKTINGALESIINTLNTGADNYGKAFNKPWTKILFTPTIVSVAQIAKDASEAVGIVNEQAVKNAEEALEFITDQTKTFLDDCKRILNRSGFYGKDEQSTLDSSVGAINKSLDGIMDTIQKETGIKTDRTIEKARKVAGQNVQNYTVK